VRKSELPVELQPVGRARYARMFCLHEKKTNLDKDLQDGQNYKIQIQIIQ
jgi:hypothetical protein